MSDWTNPRVLVTGGWGFIGRHLVRELQCQGVDPVRLGRSARPGADRYIQADLCDPVATADALDRVDPTHIFHLAGELGGPKTGWETLLDANVLATANLLDATRRMGSDPWLLVASSSAVYGPGSGDLISEAEPFRPLTAYGATKAAQELVCVQNELAFGLRIVRARVFNTIGPNQAPTLVISDIARQIATAETDGCDTIRVGNLNAERDFTDVRDIARAMALLGEHHAPAGPYNIASGVARSIRSCVEILLRQAKRPVTVEIEETRLRTEEIPTQRGDSSRLHHLVDWRPEIPIEQSLNDVLGDWRVIMARG